MIMLIIEDKKKLNKEMKKDKVRFEWLMDFVDVCHEHEFQCKLDFMIDAYNNAVIELDKLANKYKLHDSKRREVDVWYEMDYLWPKMKEFFEIKDKEF